MVTCRIVLPCLSYRAQDLKAYYGWLSEEERWAADDAEQASEDEVTATGPATSKGLTGPETSNGLIGRAFLRIRGKQSCTEDEARAEGRGPAGRGAAGRGP